MTKYNINQNHFFKIKEGILQWVAYNAVVRNDLGQYQHEYVLRDHLGNTRVTFTDGVNKGEPYWDWSNYSYIQPDNTGYDDGVVTEADIKHINHTYPFGMAMEGNWNNAGSANNNRYLYNGKQYNDDFGMGWYDYGARFYDPAIGRWNTIDPLAGKYPSWSPYSYVMDNPVSFFDKDGREPVLPIYTITYTVQVYKVETREVCETAVTDPLLGSTERVNCQTVTEKTLVAEVDFNFTVEQQKCGGVKMLSESGAQGAATQISGEKSEDVSKVTGSSDVALTSDKTMGTITLKVDVDLKQEGFAITVTGSAGVGAASGGLEYQKNVTTQEGSGSVQVVIPFDGHKGLVKTQPANTNINISPEMKASQGNKPYAVEVHQLKVDKIPMTKKQ